jgi:hypothetical protein
LQIFINPLAASVFLVVLLFSSHIISLTSRACLAGLQLLRKQLQLWLLRWSGFSGVRRSCFEKCLAKQLLLYF